MGIDHFHIDEPTVVSDRVARFTWTPVNDLLTPAGTLQGGAGLGATCAAMQQLTGRPVIWATAQYLSYAPGLDPLDIEVTIEVAGHNTTQARAVLSRAGREILTTHAALGSREFPFEDHWATPPPVAAPADCPPYRFFEKGRPDLGSMVEFRLAKGRQLDDIVADPTRGDGSFALWVRCWSGRRPVTVPDVAFIGDFMPLGFAEALGAPYAGNSLDNTIRIGRSTGTEWVLVSVDVRQVVNGIGYGSADLFAEDGTLLGGVGQSSVLRKHGAIRNREHLA